MLFGVKPFGHGVSQEKILLKSQLKAKCFKMNNSSNKICDVTNDYVHALEKPLYSSFFKKNTKYKAEFNRINKPLRQIIDYYFSALIMGT